MPPLPLTVRRAPLNEVLDAVQAKLAAGLGWTTDRILKVAREAKETPKFTGDQDILLRFKGFRADVGKHRDRHDCRVFHRLSIIARTRLELDEADRDEDWLEDPTLGAIPLWLSIIDALQIWIPKDAKGNHLAFEGMAVVEGNESAKDAKAKGWGETELIFQVGTELPLTLDVGF